ncbi:alpha/beta fold hydrolase [Lentzea flava]|uniref:Hydrolase n=1 Tax=Lentzea flava TaxID=103732 RepID=A0ABQ2UEY5_9PSEU|nr:alpha/beta hydrolase [Lentzea flava]MCP2198051.1 Pimeloyl-ACP methyl ester carboxylesterase [Lentzea flava]GGU24344.1 hydrolase [Lentzea flava]
MPTHTLETDGAAVVYDVHGEGGRPLMMIGQPMDASGFSALVAQFPDRTVITYDPRGLGRSTRSDGSTENRPEIQAADVHAVIQAVGGPVDLFASSGGAVTALELVATYPDDVVTLVAHEPPIIDVLPDADAARRARDGFMEAYQAKGWGAGMAAFMQMSSWQGEYTDEYFALPAPDPAQFGMPAEDDGKRDDPLLGTASVAITDYQPKVDALKAAPTRVVIAVGEETGNAFTARTAVHTARLLGQEAVVFPSHHGGFMGGEFGYAGKPEEFGVRLREVLG